MKYRLIGIYELFTGILGVLLVLFNIGKVLEDKSELFTFFTGIMLFTGLAIAGYTLMKKGHTVARYSVMAQALQLFSITQNGMQYLFTASAFLSIYFNKGFHFHALILPINYNIAEVSAFLPFEFRIFLFPVLLIILLLTGNKK